jgi:putative hydrolase of HD superfamily
MSLKRDLELIYEVGSLRFVDRAWKQFFGPDLQNVSEHSFRIIFTALMIARMEKAKIDEAKLLKMAMVHDLVESRTGDTHYQSRRYCHRDEQMAIKDILKSTVFEKEFLEIYQEFEDRKSLEAKIVKDADNLDIDIEIKETTTRGGKVPSTWKDHRKKVYKDYYTASAKRLAKAILSSDPNDWHQLGRNRFNTGDWKK